MYCTHCGNKISEQTALCMSCGCTPRAGDKHCSHCGKELLKDAAICPACGVSTSQSSNAGTSKISAGLLAIFLGWIGIHKFYLGYSNEGLIMVVTSFVGGVITCGISMVIMFVIGFIEGCIYLSKTDEEFKRIYVDNRRGWF